MHLIRKGTNKPFSIASKIGNRKKNVLIKRLNVVFHNCHSVCEILFVFCSRYIESMVHFASIRHPASILDDLHGKVLNEVYQISKSTVSESVSNQYNTQRGDGTLRP